MCQINVNGRVAKWMMMVLSIPMMASEGSLAQTASQDAAPAHWAIALHGGAGRIPRDLPREQVDAMNESLRRALEAGKGIVAAGGAATDAVEAVVVVLEDDPRFNAGKGAVFTSAGTHELDAAIMDGAMLRCGAVGGAKRPKNPIKVARLVMERTPHVLLVGAGADEFAGANDCELVAQDYFFTERQFRELQQTLAKKGVEAPTTPAYPLPKPAVPQSQSPSDGAHGTVGCVALDTHGNLAAATSTGGLTGKLSGRVGDTPIIGAGTYANRTAAVSCTGIGEQFIRHSIAARVIWLIEDRKLTVDQAASHCLGEILNPGDGGIIAVDRDGNITMQSSTGSMARAAADSTGRLETAIWFDH